MQFRPSILFNDLTIGIVGHNLSSLFYPHIESFWSAIPLGCRFLLGCFDCTDDTRKHFERWKDYAPTQIVDGPWEAKEGGRAIGIATQYLLDRCQTPFFYNLQACEVLSDNFIDSLLNLYYSEKIKGHDCGDKPTHQLDGGMATFRHIWGTFNFDGSIGGHAYHQAQRLMHRNCRIDHGDGCNPEPHGGYDIGIVFRYAYCFRNQIKVKTKSQNELYKLPDAYVTKNLNSIEWCRQNPNYYENHPSYVQHLIGHDNYDNDYSLQVFSANVTRL